MNVSHLLWSCGAADHCFLVNHVRTPRLMDDVWDDSDDDIPRAVERTPVQPFQKDLEKLEEIHSNVISPLNMF